MENGEQLKSRNEAKERGLITMSLNCSLTHPPSTYEVLTMDGVRETTKINSMLG